MAKKRKSAKNKKIERQVSNGQIFGGVGLVMALIFMPSTFLLIVGMLPTMVAGFVDRSSKGSKAVAVGAINLAGCMPYLLQLWSQGHSIEKSISIVSDPAAIVVMYSAAGVGYVIDWALTGFISSLLYNRGQKRAKAIKKKKAELVERWGKEVTGEVPLDEYGFGFESVETQKE